MMAATRDVYQRRVSCCYLQDEGKHLNSYKMQLIQEEKPFYHSQRQHFVNWFLEQFGMDNHFGQTIFLNDEVYF